jgi:hypothetical protein
LGFTVGLLANGTGSSWVIRSRGPRTCGDLVELKDSTDDDTTAQRMKMYLGDSRGRLRRRWWWWQRQGNTRQ